MTTVWIVIQEIGYPHEYYFDHPVKAFTKEADAMALLDGVYASRRAFRRAVAAHRGIPYVIGDGFDEDEEAMAKDFRQFDPHFSASTSGYHLVWTELE